MTTTPNAGNEAGIDLARLEQLAQEAKKWDLRSVKEVAPDTVLALIALARATPQQEPAPTFPEVQAEEAKLYRDLTGDAMALGFDGLVAALEALRATPQPSADRAPADGAGILHNIQFTRMQPVIDPNAVAALESTRIEVRAVEWAAPTAGDSATPAPIYATGGVNDIADELEAEALNYEGDFADTVKGCVEALREIAATPQHSVAEQARERIAARFANRPRTPATADFDLPAPNDDVPGAHHLTPESIAATIKDLREIESGTPAVPVENRDSRTEAGVLARIIEYLVICAQPLASTAATQPEQANELRSAAFALLNYLDEHDWGGIPEETTTNRFRAALAIPASTAASEQQAGADERALTDEQIIEALHGQGIDTYPSKYGFDAAQVSATSVPNLRKVIEKCAAVTHRATTATSKDVQTTSKTAADQQDAERLDWLVINEAWIGYNPEGTHCRVLHQTDEGDVVPLMGADDRFWYGMPREAIDAAQAAPATSGGENG